MNESSDSAYREIEHRLTCWAHDQKDVRALVVVGSRATSKTTRDAFSDLDVLLVARRPNSYVDEVNWLDQIELIQSVLDVRRFLSHELGHGSLSSEFVASLRAMRAACRKLLDTVQEGGNRLIVFGLSRGHYASWVFLPALGELRGVFGIHLARIAALHGLDVEEPLSSILPAAPEKEGGA